MNNSVRAIRKLSRANSHVFSMYIVYVCVCVSVFVFKCMQSVHTQQTKEYYSNRAITMSNACVYSLLYENDQLKKGHFVYNPHCYFGGFSLPYNTNAHSRNHHHDEFFHGSISISICFAYIICIFRSPRLSLPLSSFSSRCVVILQSFNCSILCSVQCLPISTIFIWFLFNFKRTRKIEIYRIPSFKCLFICFKSSKVQTCFLLIDLTFIHAKIRKKERKKE